MRSNAQSRVSLTTALLLGAVVLSQARAETLVLPNGLDASWEAGGGYDAVCLTFACPMPASDVEQGVRPILLAVLSASAERSGGPADKVASLGGGLSIEEHGGRISLVAVGARGSAPALIEAIAETVLEPASTEALAADGSLIRHLNGLTGALTVQGAAVRRLLGPAWWATPSEISAAARVLGYADLSRYRKEWLAASRGAVSVVSASLLDARTALAPLAALPSGTAIHPLYRDFGLRAGDRESRGEDRGQSVVALVTAGPDPFGPDAPPWQVTAYFLGHGNGSPLFRHLRTDEGLCYSTGCRWMVEEGGLLWAEAHCDPGDEARTEAALRRVVAESVESGVTVEDADAARRQAKLAWVNELSSSARRARFRAAGMAIAGDAAWPEAFIEAIERVTPQDIRRVLETLGNESLVLDIESG